MPMQAANQDAFLKNLAMLWATIAFGMRIDKPDVLCHHHDIPKVLKVIIKRQDALVEMGRRPLFGLLRL